MSNPNIINLNIINIDKTAYCLLESLPVKLEKLQIPYNDNYEIKNLPIALRKLRIVVGYLFFMKCGGANANYEKICSNIKVPFGCKLKILLNPVSIYVHGRNITKNNILRKIE